MPKYSVVIPTYNHCNDLLVPCLNSILKYTDLTEVEVIVVANGCTDNTREYVESLGPKFKLIWIDEPNGYTKSANVGIKACSGEYIILLNNDIELLPQETNKWINLLESPFKDPEVGLTGPAIGWHYGLSVFGIIFYCVMIKRQVFDTIGLLDEVYSPGGVEDFDFSHRAALAGYKLADAKENINGEFHYPLEHKENQTLKEPSIGYKKILERNNAIFERKYRRPPKYSIVVPTYDHCDDLLKPCIESIIKFSNLEDIELIVVSNGCRDETVEYLKYLEAYFHRRGFPRSFKYIVDRKPLGYAKATNLGIKQASCEKIVLLNNDVLLLEQTKNRWLEQLNSCFVNDPDCGISCVLKTYSEAAGKHFAVFFCVMIHKKVFDKIGLLNEDYEVGGAEDIEFSIEAEKAGFKVVEALNKAWSFDKNIHTGNFPLYHQGEGTVHDASLVPEWGKIFRRNCLKLAKKYNIDWYNKNYE